MLKETDYINIFLSTKPWYVIPYGWYVIYPEHWISPPRERCWIVVLHIPQSSADSAEGTFTSYLNLWLNYENWSHVYNLHSRGVGQTQRISACIKPFAHFPCIQGLMILNVARKIIQHDCMFHIVSLLDFYTGRITIHSMLWSFTNFQPIHIWIQWWW